MTTDNKRDPNDVLHTLRDWDELLSAYRRPCSDDLRIVGGNLASALRDTLAVVDLVRSLLSEDGVKEQLSCYSVFHILQERLENAAFSAEITA